MLDTAGCQRHPIGRAVTAGPSFREPTHSGATAPRRLIIDQRCDSHGNWHSSPVDERVCHVAGVRSLCVPVGPRIGPAGFVPATGYPTTERTASTGLSASETRVAVRYGSQERRGAKYWSSCTRAVISTSAAARQCRQRLGRSGSAWTVPHRSQARNWSPVTFARRWPERKTLPASGSWATTAASRCPGTAPTENLVRT